MIASIFHRFDEVVLPFFATGYLRDQVKSAKIIVIGRLAVPHEISGLVRICECSHSQILMAEAQTHSIGLCFVLSFMTVDSQHCREPEEE